jgi:hypothetical protein
MAYRKNSIRSQPHLWKKKCPQCGRTQRYKSYGSWWGCQKMRTVCEPCQYKNHKSRAKLAAKRASRECPMCRRKLRYKTLGKFNNAERVNAVCSKCRQKRSGLSRNGSRWSSKRRLSYEKWSKLHPRKVREIQPVHKHADSRHPERWVKNCTKCGDKIHYKRYGTWHTAMRSNKTRCSSCLKSRDKDSHYNGIVYGNLTRECSKCSDVITYKTRGRFRQAVDRGSFCPSCRCSRQIGKQRSHRTKQLLRKATANHHAKYGPGVDVGASEFFSAMNLHNGFHIQHPNVHFADLGYFADGYDPVLHAWFEYDTKSHRCKKYRARDAVRQSRIIKYFQRRTPLRHFFRVNRTGVGASGMSDVLNFK